MTRILCWFGCHAWIANHVWTPSVDAPIVTRYQCAAICKRCYKPVYIDQRFDPITGEPVEDA